MGILLRRQCSTVQKSAGVEESLKSRRPSPDESLLNPPSLRRSRSSSEFFASFYDDDNESNDWKVSLAAPTLSVPATLALWIRGATTDFRKNGLPWDGPVCRSKWAGLSGIMYLLPALAAFGHPFDQIMWILQACLSILADYVYICQDSFWHGIDRCFAIFNLFTILGRASIVLHWSVGLLTIIPVSCYVCANRAKTRKDARAWHFWHGMWHVTGGPLACLVIYIIHHGAESTPRSVEGWVQSWLSLW
jgi:hypothetical protein